MSGNPQNPLNSFLDTVEDATQEDFGRLFAQPAVQAPPAQPILPQEQVQPAAPPQVQTNVPQAPASQPVQQPVVQIAPPPAPAAEIPAAPPPLQETGNGQMSLNDPFEAAMKKAQGQRDERISAAFAENNPVFSYGKASDEITDNEITFDQLREQYETDFPELAEKKKVSWSVTYGKVTKNISNPESDKVFVIKAEIEKSKAFLDGIKNAKKDEDKDPKCLVKPRVTAQSKGERNRIPGYKGYSASYEDAIQSDKPIVIIPSSSGQVYEMRKTNMGTFMAPADFLPEFPDLHPAFVAKQKIPMSLLYSIISFFRTYSDMDHLEVLVHILYNTQSGKFEVRVPKQTVSRVSVHADIDEGYPEHLEHVMDIHSHNAMPAKFSETDNRDEKATRLYGVIGRLDRYFPEINLRASCGGKFIPVSLQEIFETSVESNQYPKEWEDQIGLWDTKKADNSLLPPSNDHPRFISRLFPLLLKGGDSGEIQ